MKAILMPTHPKWCELIASGKKTIDARKSKPTLETPFKCYIYATKDKWEHLVQMPDKSYRIYDGRMWGPYDKSLWFEGESNGKVIGEFVCDRIDEYKNNFCAWRDKNGKQFDVGKLLSDACLTLDKMSNYISGSVKFYGWHISDLKIYDKPKELSEFTTPFCPYEVTKCKVGARLCKYFTFKDALGGECDYAHRVTRPPQSWYYVEEI